MTLHSSRWGWSSHGVVVAGGDFMARSIWGTSCHTKIVANLVKRSRYDVQWMSIPLQGHPNHYTSLTSCLLYYVWFAISGRVGR